MSALTQLWHSLGLNRDRDAVRSCVVHVFWAEQFVWAQGVDINLLRLSVYAPGSTTIYLLLFLLFAYGTPIKFRHEHSINESKSARLKGLSTFVFPGVGTPATNVFPFVRLQFTAAGLSGWVECASSEMWPTRDGKVTKIARNPRLAHSETAQ